MSSKASLPISCSRQLVQSFRSGARVCCKRTIIPTTTTTTKRYLASVPAPSPNPGPPPHHIESQFLIGQPTHEAHPHLLKSGELTRGISALEYATRRAKLANDLPTGSVAILCGASLQYRSGPVFHEFHQNTDFFYLTGFDEPDAICVIEKTGTGAEHIFHLYTKPRDDAMEMWEGPRAGPNGAKDIFNADVSASIEDKSTPDTLQQMINQAKYVYGTANLTKPKQTIWSKLGGRSSKQQPALLGVDFGNKTVKQIAEYMHQLRMKKSFAEITNMRNAGRISGRAFNETIERRFKREADMWAFIEYQFRLGGCEKSAYVPVIAGGKNGLLIHYTRNNDLLRDGDMVLVDAGGQYGGYITDITRTWPVNGKFTDPQRDLYQAVLNVQRKCVSLCHEAAKVSLDDLHNTAEVEIYDSLRDLGFDITKRDVSSTFFPHHLGHYVGLDIHDCSTMGKAVQLKAGHCVTIEPGIYVPDDPKWPKHFRNMAIRIEDTVCVGEDAPLNLSVNAAKEIVDIEALAEE